MKGDEPLPAGKPAGAPVQSRTVRRNKILVVDQDSDLRKLYTEVLAHSGYHVDGAEDGAAGWKALQAGIYNLLITEHALSKVTGIELVKSVRAARMALPVVMAAERLPTHALARNPSLHVAALLPKPFYISELLETVKTVLRAADHPSENYTPLPNWPGQPPAVGLRPYVA